jgi:hypothetical protein
MTDENHVAHYQTGMKESEPRGGTGDWLFSQTLKITKDKEKGTEMITGLLTHI